MAFYKTERWRKMRRAQLRREPLCRLCLKYGITKPARVADHVVPHRFDPQAFWHGELQSLCDECHGRAKQSDEYWGYSRDVGYDGWPEDERHPRNRQGRGG